MTTAPAADELTLDQIHTLTPEQATAKLAERQAAYVAANEPAKKEPTPLTGADGEALTARHADHIVQSPAERAAQLLDEGKTHLEGLNFPARDSVEGAKLWDMIEGREKVSAEQHATAQRMLTQMTRDAEFSRKVMTGDADAMKNWQMVNGVLAAWKIQNGS